MKTHPRLLFLASVGCILLLVAVFVAWFVRTQVVALNYSARQFAHEDVVMIGLSVGGWTMTLYAALDPRVRLSFPVAGTLPDYLREGVQGIGSSINPLLFPLCEDDNIYMHVL